LKNNKKFPKHKRPEKQIFFVVGSAGRKKYLLLFSNNEGDYSKSKIRIFLSKVILKPLEIYRINSCSILSALNDEKRQVFAFVT
jgi:hypothetical protein